MNNRYPIEAANDAINHGTREKADVYTELHLLAKSCEEGMKALKEAGLVEEIQQHGKDGLSRNGIKLVHKNGGARMDWSTCSPVTTAEAALKDLKDAWKLRAQLALKPGGQTEYVDEGTGEILRVPIIKYDADTIVATSSKEF